MTMNKDNQLVPVFNNEIGGVNQLVCDARSLHKSLNIGKDFTTWIKGRIEEYGFIEGLDYFVLNSKNRKAGIFPKIGENSNEPLLAKSGEQSKSENVYINQQNGIFANFGEKSAIPFAAGFSEANKPTINVENQQDGIFPEIRKNSNEPLLPKIGKQTTNRGRPSIDYVISLTMAKELAMVEKNETGRAIRRYFIQCEQEKYNESIPKPTENTQETLNNEQGIFLYDVVRLLGWARRMLKGTYSVMKDPVFSQDPMIYYISEFFEEIEELITKLEYYVQSQIKYIESEELKYKLNRIMNNRFFKNNLCIA